MTTESIRNRTDTLKVPVDVKIPAIQFMLNHTWGRIIRNQKRKFLSKRTMVLIDVETGLMECKVCGTRHFALVPPKGGTEDIGLKGYKRGSWQCENGCRIRN